MNEEILLNPKEILAILANVAKLHEQFQKDLEADRKEREAEVKRQKEEREAEAKHQKEEQEAEAKLQKEKREEWEKEFKAKQEENDRILQKVSKQLGGVGENLGCQTEEFFYQGFRRNLQNVAGFRFDEIERNSYWKGKEYDIILFNGNSLMLVSVKYRLHPNDIKTFVEEDVPTFKKDFIQYNNYNIYAGVATFSMGEGVEKIAEDKGLFVFTQSGTDPQLLNAPDFQPKVF